MKPVGRGLRWTLVLGVLTVAAAACSTGSPPEVTNGDPVLEQGRDVYGSTCASCHGASGGGGRGVAFSGGRLLENVPDPTEQARIIREGRDSMPRFDGRLSDEQIDAVVRYTREVIALVE